MKLITRALVVVLILSVSACVTLEKSTRINSNLKASGFNDLSSEYIARPTFVSLEEYDEGTKAIKVDMTRYDGRYNSFDYPLEFTAEYIALIDNFLKWEKLALERKDQLEKLVGTAPAWKGGTGQFEFTFFSGNQFSHYLLVKYCNHGDCDYREHYYDTENALILKKLLTDAASGQISTIRTDEIYN